MKNLRNLISVLVISYGFTQFILPMTISEIQITNEFSILPGVVTLIFLGCVAIMVLTYVLMTRIYLEGIESIVLLALVLYLLRYVFELASFNYLVGAAFFLIILFVYSSFVLIYMRLSNQRKEMEYLDKDEFGNESFGRLCLVMLIPLFLAVPVTMFYEKLAENNITTLKKNPISEDGTRKEYAEEYRDVLEKFIPENYSLLSLKERLDALQYIEFIEARLTGRPANKVISGKLGQDMIGKYDSLRNLIIISNDQLSSNDAEETLRVTLHEAQHSNQFYLANAVNWSNDNVYTLEFFEELTLINSNLRHYIDYSRETDNYDEYNDQIIEVEADFNAIVALFEYASVVKGISPYFDSQP